MLLTRSLRPLHVMPRRRGILTTRAPQDITSEQGSGKLLLPLAVVRTAVVPLLDSTKMTPITMNATMIAGTT